MSRANVLFSNDPPEPPKDQKHTSESSEYRKQVYKMINGIAKTPFSAILDTPKVFTFSDQTENEKVILVVRQHWFVNLKWITMALVMILAPMLLQVVPLFDFLPLKFQAVSLFFWYLLTFAFAFEGFLSWWFNVFVVTEERIVDIDFINLLNSKVSDAQLDKIQDVSYEVAGLGGTFLNFGSIFIQTAGEIPEIEIKNAPSPDMIAKVLQTLRLEEQQEALEGRLK